MGKFAFDLEKSTSLHRRPLSNRYQQAHLSNLEEVIEHAAQMLPAEGPITGFVFLNPLHAFEDLAFHEAVTKGVDLFGCQPYYQEDRYRAELAKGRIRALDLRAVLEEELREEAWQKVAQLSSRLELRLAMLRHPVLYGSPGELRWYMSENDSLKRFREDIPVAAKEKILSDTFRWVVRDIINAGGKDGGYLSPLPGEPRRQHVLWGLIRQFGEDKIDKWNAKTWEAFTLQALWRVCSEGVDLVQQSESTPEPKSRPRDVLLQATGVDTDLLVHPMLIRFCAAFTDQGLATLPLPNRASGFLNAFCELYREGGLLQDRWLRDLPREIALLESSRFGAMESIHDSLIKLGIDEDEWESFIPATMVALRGWASMIRQMEVRGDRVHLPVPSNTLTEFLAIRLILERLALAYVAREELDYTGPLENLCSVAERNINHDDAPGVEYRTYLVFHLAQILGWCPSALQALSKNEWKNLLDEISAFSSIERRGTFHRAFERRFRIRSLDAIASHSRKPDSRIASPRFQAVFCIDTREAAFRRHLEETAPDVETFGAAGFFGVPIYFRGIADAHPAALCPIVVRPQHWLNEEVIYPLVQTHQRRAKTRRLLGNALHGINHGSQAFALGAMLTGGIGVLASVPLVARVLFPRFAGWVSKLADSVFGAPPLTRLNMERSTEKPGPAEESTGFSLEEMANFGERMLRDIALTSGFARLVLFIGHGSHCLNNPHRSAYDCGACSGNPGGPNARALATMLNHPEVRKTLTQRGLPIPHETMFLGGQHNTSNDTIEFFDLDLLPKSHQADFEGVKHTLEQVCERNSHERCRRFRSAPLSSTLAAAHRHVANRSEDLAQTRPEFGNATNALCVVGRRSHTRGLFLDRRCFLQSYDPAQDDAESTILARLLSAVVPVCQGINLEYFFSSVDTNGWGSGTKLPHNVTSLLGVMDGAASDLRQGLPWQGVEIHEPLRLLFVIETTPAAILSIMERNPQVGRILRNGWAQLALLDPETSQLREYRNGTFHLYHPETTTLAKADTSLDWYVGCRDHLDFAQIVNEQPQLN